MPLNFLLTGIFIVAVSPGMVCTSVICCRNVTAPNLEFVDVPQRLSGRPVRRLARYAGQEDLSPRRGYTGCGGSFQPCRCCTRTTSSHNPRSSTAGAAEDQRRKGREFHFATPGDVAGGDTRNLRGVMPNSPLNSLNQRGLLQRPQD